MAPARARLAAAGAVPRGWLARVRRLAALLVVVAVGAAAVVAIQPWWAIDLLARLDSRVVWRVETDEPLAALTFDDGPDAVYTPQVLDALARHDARATFFLIGAHAARHAALVERIRREGHEIGNHTATGEPALRQALHVFQESVIEAEGVLGLEDVRPRFLRPGSGLLRRTQLEWITHRGYVCVLGSAYPYDPAEPPLGYMRWLIAKNLRPGAIVVLHDSGGDRVRTAAVLPDVVDAGRRAGLRFVTLSELWAARRGGGQGAGRLPHLEQPHQ